MRVPIDLYVYLYAKRYFLTKFITNRDLPPTEYDLLVSQAFERVQSSVSTVEKAERFAPWLSVVCVNLFRNYLRRRRKVSSLEDAATDRLEGDTIDLSSLDKGAVKITLLAAIVRLPDYLREIARLRLIENRSYEQIAETTGRDKGTLRSYVNKAVSQLRTDDGLRDLREDG